MLEVNKNMRKKKKFNPNEVWTEEELENYLGNILSKSSFLYDEPNFLLQHEVMEVGSYFSVIKSIAAGNQKLSKIAGALELKQTGLTKYLKTLIDLNILEREVPITEENPGKSKRGLYKIKDNFILFWFKVGRSWRNDTEIDFVALDSTGDGIILVNANTGKVKSVSMF